MPRRLTVLNGPDKGRAFDVPDTDPLLLGRSKATQTRLGDPHVSRVHCEVGIEAGRVVVHDFDSAGGTFVNGRRVSRQELRPGDLVRIGDTELRFEDDAAEAPTIPPPDAGGPAIVIKRKPGAAPLPPALQRLHDLVGKALGRYELQGVLGTGQVGVVFRAIDTTATVPVALKVFKSEMAGDAKAMQRLVRGVMAARSLTHPHLVELLAAGKTDAYWWMAMELVEGESLAQVIQKARGPVRELSLALRMATHVSRALGFAHGHGLIHRNVMPPNVLIQSTDGLTKLGDLVLAKELEETVSRMVSKPGELVGNIYYMSPERTQAGAAVDGRSDIFSLGVTLYQTLTGKLPFTGSSLPDVVQKIRQAEPARPRQLEPSVPEPLDRVVLKMLARRPEDRYPTAAALTAELEQLARAAKVSL